MLICMIPVAQNIEDGQNSNITKTCLFKYAENFTTKKWKIFR